MKKVIYKFEIGQTVRVTDDGCQYSSWGTKAADMGLKQWKADGGLRTRQVAKIIAQDIHDDGRTIIYGITREDGSQYIIGEEGLEAYTETFTPQTAITISRELLGEYYDAATEDQRKYMSDNFKLNGETTVEAIIRLHDIACGKWKAIIKKNHPECFPEESKYFDLSHLLEDKEESNKIFTDEQAKACGFENSDFFQVRGHGDYKHKGFYLSDRYDWEILEEASNCLVLVPTKKK